MVQTPYLHDILPGVWLLVGGEIYFFAHFEPSALQVVNTSMTCSIGPRGKGDPVEIAPEINSRRFNFGHVNDPFSVPTWYNTGFFIKTKQWFLL